MEMNGFEGNYGITILKRSDDSVVKIERVEVTATSTTSYKVEIVSEEWSAEFEATPQGEVLIGERPLSQIVLGVEDQTLIGSWSGFYELAKQSSNRADFYAIFQGVRLH